MEQIRVSTFAGPGAQPVIHTVPRPKISSKAALIKIGACGVCGTDLHILKGHWPKQLPWPFTLGHELGGVLVEVGNGRYLGFDKPPHLWGGWAEYVYVDLDMLPGTKVYKLPDDMSLRLGALSEPLTSCIRAFNRAARAGGFSWG